mgnify:CR=1 FL=1
MSTLRVARKYLLGEHDQWDAATFDWKDIEGMEEWLRWAMQENSYSVLNLHTGSDQYAFLAIDNAQRATQLAQQFPGVDTVVSPEAFLAAYWISQERSRRDPIVFAGKDPETGNDLYDRASKVLARRQGAMAVRVANKALHDPRFNLREIVKQLLLLEEHLAHADKLCPDCVTKHLMTIEALAEEATCLNTGQVTPQEACDNIAERARGWLTSFKDGSPPADIAADIRIFRKNLAPKVSDPR